MSGIFEKCSATLDLATETSEFLKCMSDEFTTTSDAGVSTAASVDDLKAGVNTFWLLFAGALVFFMQPGFAMLCAGSIRAKNVKNVILWNLLDSAGGGLAYWACGWAFSYGGDDGSGTTFVGTKNFFLMGEVPHHLWFFQFAFASALSSIVAGTIAERTAMSAYLLYSFFLVGFVYPVVAHCFWSTNGFLSAFNPDPLWNSGIVDFAGSGPVHMTGGVTALVAAIILGPRMGRFHDEDGNPLEEPTEFPPHSVTLQFLGTFCLWFGWYGFNPGSTLAIGSAAMGEVASLAAANTTLAACTGAVSAMFLSTLYDIRYHGIAQWDTMFTMNGALTGLVAITAGCATVDTWAAVVIGFFAGLFYLLGSKLLIRLRIDDAVDAIPVHMIGGAWGVISTGLFSNPQRMEVAFGRGEHGGWFYEWSSGGDFTFLGIQLIGVVMIFVWTATTMGIYFYVLNMFGLLRISKLEEEVGMDISRHKGSAYNYAEGSAPADKVSELNTSRRFKTHQLELPDDTKAEATEEQAAA